MLQLTASGFEVKEVDDETAAAARADVEEKARRVTARKAAVRSHAPSPHILHMLSPFVCVFCDLCDAMVRSVRRATVEAVGDTGGRLCTISERRVWVSVYAFVLGMSRTGWSFRVALQVACVLGRNPSSTKGNKRYVAHTISDRPMASLQTL